MIRIGAELEFKTPDRVTLAWVLGAGLVAVLPLSWELGPWPLVAFALGILWRRLMERYDWLRPGRLLLALLLLGVSLAVWWKFRTFLGRDPGLTLLVSLLGLKFLELRQARDCRISLMAFYILIAGSFLYEQTLVLGLYSALTVAVNTAALIRLAQPQGLSWRANLGLSATLLAQALPLTLVIYFFFPRLPGAIWALPGSQDMAQTGLSDSMRPGAMQRLIESSQVAFRATFSAPSPPARDLYWRALVLWDTDGRVWNRGRLRPFQDEALIPSGPALEYEILLEASRHSWAPVLDMPADFLEGTQPRTGYTFEFVRPASDRRRYRAESYLDYRTPRLSGDERAAALRLPKLPNPRTKALGEEWAQSLASPREIVQQALVRFRQENFIYSLNPPSLGEHPMDDFLFETRKGYCEHYAAAFVTLMRAAGVPARVVNGYQGGELNPAGNYYIVRQWDAHAWAEVWLEPKGWTRVDPTSAVAPERVEMGMDALRRLAARGTLFGSLTTGELWRRIEAGLGEQLWNWTRLYWDLVNISWDRWVADYQQERQEWLLEQLNLKGLSRLGLIALALAGVAGLLTLYALWRRRERPRLDPAQVQYLRYCRKLARVGLTRAGHEGPQDFARRCLARRPDLAGPVSQISNLYQQVRYAGQGGAEAQRRLAQAVSGFRPSKG